MRNRKDERGRTLPYGWYEKEIVRQINRYYQMNPEIRIQRSAVLLTYAACTMIASDQQSDRFIATQKTLSDYTGLSKHTVLRAMNVLASIPVLIKFQTLGRKSNQFELFNAHQPGTGDTVQPGTGDTVGRGQMPNYTTYSRAPGIPQPGTGDTVDDPASLYRERNKGREREGYTDRDKLLPAQILIFRSVTGILPKQILWEKIAQAIGKASAKDLTPYYVAWCERGYNPSSIAWLTDWFAKGEIPQGRFGPAKSNNKRSDEPEEPDRNDPQFKEWQERNIKRQMEIDKERAAKARAEKEKATKP